MPNDSLFDLRNKLEETYLDLRDMPEGPARDRAFAGYRAVQSEASKLLEPAGLDAVSAQERLDRASERFRPKGEAKA